MQVLANAKGDTESRRGVWRYVNRLHLACIQSRDAHLGAILKTRNVRKLRVDLEGSTEEHATITDQEQTDAEQQHACDHEGTHGGGAAAIHIGRLPCVLRGHERSHQLVICLVEGRWCPSRDDAALMEHH